MAAGHSVPTCYALWMILGQALERRHSLTGDARYRVDPERRDAADRCAGFPPRRGRDGDLLQDHGLADHPLFAQAKARGIKALAGHAESVDVTNDVNGGPSGVGVATVGGQGSVLGHRGRARVLPR